MPTRLTQPWACRPPSVAPSSMATASVSGGIGPSTRVQGSVHSSATLARSDDSTCHVAAGGPWGPRGAGWEEERRRDGGGCQAGGQSGQARACSMASTSWRASTLSASGRVS
eukprot:scaffold25029_cov75-Phaeocystis_antarctica.AAC.1